MCGEIKPNPEKYLKVHGRIALNAEDAEAVCGGAWNFDTLTPDELEEYNHLQDLWQNAEDEQNWDIQIKIEEQINAFIDRMDDQYGA